jgi:hypothetical protein
MAKLEVLDLEGLGYTGKSGASPVMPLVYRAVVCGTAELR